MTQFRSPSQSAPVSEYLRSRVMSASPEELRLMLLEGGIKYISQGKAALERKDFEGMFNGLSAGRNIVMELMMTIRPEPNPKLAETVKALYTFIYTLLVDAGMEKDTGKLAKVIQLLEYERETWVLLMQQLAAERTPVHAARHESERAPLSVQG
jgi:flagellar protein FliS